MPDPFVLPASSTWLVPSDSDVPGLRISLSLPVRPTTRNVDVLVLLDGDFLHLSATEIARTLNLVTIGDFPPIAVVGVMRDEPHPGRYVSHRFRDFTPQPWVLPGPFADDNAMATWGTGGASELLADIETHVLPRVGSDLDSAGFFVGDLAVGGWSLSGLFACWAWIERPDLFAHLLAISPSLWWHDASILDRPVPPRSSTHRAFVCAGEHEEGDLRLVYPQRFANAPQRELAAMVRNARRFAELATTAGAHVDGVIVADEHHVTVQSAALARGMRHLFG